MGKPSRKRKNPLRPHGSTDRRSPHMPHSSAWFETMLATDTHRAISTGIVLNRVGRLDACSVCGDAPAPIYDDLDAPFLPLRLCDGCLEIRTVGFGERYAPRAIRSEDR